MKFQTNRVIPFGIRKSDGKLVHVDEVPQGLACDCECPSCRTPLVARKGEVRTNHFAHHNSTDCGNGLETALHKIVKDIIEEHKSFKVPEYKLKLQDTVQVGYRSSKVITEELVTNESLLNIESVDLETKIDTIIPDVIANIGGYELCIEVYVTHKVSSEKLSKIRALNIPSIEIDFSNYTYWDNYEEIKNTVIESVKNKKWLFHPRQLSTESNHSKNIEDRKKKLHIKTSNASYSTNNPKTRAQSYQSLNREVDKGLRDKFEDAGNNFYKKYGRWPSYDETIRIIDNIKSSYNKYNVNISKQSSSYKKKKYGD